MGTAAPTLARGTSMMTVKTAAAYACVSEATLRGWLREGLPHFRVGAKGKRGHIRITREDLDSWLASFKVTKHEPEPTKAPARFPSVFKHLRLS